MSKTIFIQEKGTLTVKRTFNADVALVWRAWTEAEILDKWWAPKPWYSKTKRMEFKVGGYRLYSMNGPEGEVMWGRTNYATIKQHKEFTGTDVFCDENGISDGSFPERKYSNQFIGQGGQTEIVTTTVYESEEALQQMLELGMQEGYELTLNHLEEWLEQNS